MSEFDSWTPFGDDFDDMNGGCLFVRMAPDEPNDVLAAGALWLDGGDDGLHYYAAVARFTIGAERYADTDVNDIYDAAEAFTECLDSEIDEEIGWFSTMDEACAAVEDAVETYLA